MLANSPLVQGFHHPLHVCDALVNLDDFIKVRVGSEANGQVLELYWQLDCGVVIDARFKALGSSLFIASCEWMCGYFEGKEIKQLEGLSSFSILEEQGLASKHQHVAVLMDQALLLLAKECH